MKRALPEFIINAAFPKRDYSPNEKAAVLKYMRNNGELCAAGGFVDDVISGKTVRIEDGGYRDDEYEWSDQDTYHVEKYDAAVTDDFLEHVLQRTAS